MYYPRISISPVPKKKIRAPIQAPSAGLSYEVTHKTGNITTGVAELNVDTIPASPPVNANMTKVIPITPLPRVFKMIFRVQAELSFGAPRAVYP